MTSQPAPAPLADLVLTITFGTFVRQITVHSERELTVKILATAYTAITPATGEFTRLTGRIEVQPKT